MNTSAKPGRLRKLIDWQNRLQRVAAIDEQAQIARQCARIARHRDDGAHGARARADLALGILAARLRQPGQPLADESTVGSHGLSRTTTVTLSNQDARKGRARREARAARRKKNNDDGRQGTRETQAPINVRLSRLGFGESDHGPCGWEVAN